ncbi:iron-containing redox enzyme family protein [Crossiella sp. CA198]|uniref:iron-containing redox enzyme family protein n=1 Tax=Crossiella sp. CA198 TaxID=3455607 RepID=UPI003F8D8A81
MTAVHPGPVLPRPRGPLSAAVVRILREEPGRASFPLPGEPEPFGEDLHLALYTLYELHYQGFTEADPEWEWDPALIAFRTVLERTFLAALRAGIPGGDDVGSTVDELLVEPADARGVTHFLRDEAEWWQLREYLMLRSLYHLKEADPHAWVLPRLRGRAKAALVAVEFDEFGGGSAERMHSQLYADLLAGAGLDPGYLAYLDQTPAVALATVNMMSLFGLHRALRGALVGHFAAAEITTAPSAARMALALERLGADPACVFFYTEHIEADAVHEQVLRHEVLGDLLAREPGLAADVVLGVQATEFLEQRLGEHLLGRWRAGHSALV